MANYNIEISEDNRKILHSDIVDIQKWLQNFVDNKIRQTCDNLIVEHTDRQPKKMTKDEKRALLKNLKIPRATSSLE